MSGYDSWVYQWVFDDYIKLLSEDFTQAEIDRFHSWADKHGCRKAIEIIDDYLNPQFDDMQELRM